MVFFMMPKTCWRNQKRVGEITRLRPINENRIIG